MSWWQWIFVIWTAAFAICVIVVTYFTAKAKEPGDYSRREERRRGQERH
jgi:hypothetical protein